MYKTARYEISEGYTLVAMQEAERGYLDFRVRRNEVDRPAIVVINDYSDPTVYMVKVQLSAGEALDSLDLEHYITELEEAWEAVEAIIETIMLNYDVKAM